MPGHVPAYETVKSLQYIHINNIPQTILLMFTMFSLFAQRKWCKSSRLTYRFMCLLCTSSWLCPGMSANKRVHDVYSPLKLFNNIWLFHLTLDYTLNQNIKSNFIYFTFSVRTQSIFCCFRVVENICRPDQPSAQKKHLELNIKSDSYKTQSEILLIN